MPQTTDEQVYDHPDLHAALLELRDPEETLQRIVARVSSETGFSPEQLVGPRRFKDISRARQACFYFAHKEGVTMPEIGRFFNRDHSSVHYGIAQARKRVEAARRAAAEKEDT